MASFSFFSGVTIGTQFLSSGETGFVGRDASIDGKISGSGDFIDVRVHGTVLSTGAVSLSGSQNTLMIGRTGIVEGLSSSIGGAAAIDFISFGDGATVGRLFNEGQIRGNVMGVYLFSGLEDTAYLTNAGTIFGEIAGVHTTGGGIDVIENSGLIEGFAVGVSNVADGFSSSNTVLNLTNTGTIRGPNGSVQSGDMGDRVVNRGNLWGDVSLGLGNDTLDNRGGTIDGSVDFGDGVDTFILGAGAETADGGAGAQDWIDARTGTGGVIDLLEDRGTGLALGDVLTGFERVHGSASGADTIYGNSANNLFYGYAGADSLDGDTGSDILYGGRGVDTLTGGLGNESFGFFNLFEIGDVITDFSSTGAGNDDKILIRAVNFGGGLVAGALDPTRFQSRADNVAQDTNDRFIFRTTDATLWFDADGTGAAAAVLVADLQAGATMTAADIVLV